MTYPPGPGHLHAGGPPDLPDDLDPVGLPGPHSGQDTFVLLLGVLVALLGLIATVGWVVYHHLHAGGG